MSCNSCSSSNGTPKGCKNNGTCGTDGCNKLTVFDWLENMEPLSDQKTSNIFEVRFKNGRKNYFKNSKDLSISISDLVVVGAERGYDVGFVTLKGGLIPIQLKRKKINLETTEFHSIQRIASQSDIDKWTRAREKEETEIQHMLCLCWCCVNMFVVCLFVCFLAFGSPSQGHQEHHTLAKSN